APPLKLSYRGVGEIATFVAFGPLMVMGAFLAQYPPTNSNSTAPFDSGAIAATILPGIAFGCLAAMVSLARYFPAVEEDRAKGKLTPVVRFGVGPSSLAALALGASCLAALFIFVSGP